ncbi:hypothetical protein [Streptomyces marianii]|uniref:Uncharacterized protein n=1 Tax=Streptomyces marianii TaxID=1817406 RepID=A0A5R9DWN5_9ACTN|nr:hypothetical protein [Streptomyces marianii]TLQ42051.1 hypothetical protein FEF34_01175 [Streptomyces marianii]
MTIVDTYWPAESYHEVLSDAGFALVWRTLPRLADVQRRHAPGHRTRALGDGVDDATVPPGRR